MKSSTRSEIRNDLIFLAVMLLIIGGAGRALYLDFQRSFGVGLTEEIGTVVFKQRVAERKFSHQAIFGSVKNESPVYNYDTVRTGHASSAAVILNDGTTINLDEETMVGLELTKGRGPKRLILNLTGGKIAAQRKSGSTSSVSFKTEKAEVSFNEGTLSMEQTGETLRFAGDSELTITADGKTETVAAMDQVSLVGGIVSKVEPIISLEAPPDETFLVSTAASVPVDFRWKGDAGRVRLQIAADHDFQILETEVEVASGTASAEVPEGSWYWRVAGAGDSVSDMARRLTVLADTAPRPLRPKEGEEFRGTKTTLVPLAWSPAEYASSYRLEVYDRKTPETPFKVMYGTMTSLSVELPENGTYSWRVVGLYPFAGKEIAGPPATFKLSTITALDRPVSHPTADFSSENLKSAVLAWDKVVGADAYETTLFAAGNEKTPVFTGRGPNNYLKLPPELREGEYSWQVRAFTEDLYSPPSQTRRFTMFRLLPVKLVEPKGQLPESSGAAIRFTWDDRNDGEKYLVELARDKDFSSVRKSFMAERGPTAIGGARSANLVLDESGRFYWRVSILDEAKGGDLSRAAPEEFVSPEALPPPELISPENGTHHRIYVFDELPFTWRPLEGANRYRLSLYRVVMGRENLVFSEESVAPTFNFNRFELLADDRYIWKVIAFDRQGIYDMKVSPAVSATFTFEKQEFLEAPSPEVPAAFFLPPAEPLP